jgi:hypothetical protein
MPGTNPKEPTDDALLALLSKTPGPAPWYWQTFPVFEKSTQPLTWRLDKSKPYADFAVRLGPHTDSDRIGLALAMYTTAFALPPDLLGLHFPDGPAIRVVAIDPDALECLPAAEFIARSHDQRGFASSGGVLAEFTIDANLESGEHAITLPAAFAGLRELLIVAHCAKTPQSAGDPILEIGDGAAPDSRRLRIMPQEWFNPDSFDLGYQWITRVTRDPESGRIVGDGIRLPSAFMLTQDGRRLDRWIEIDTSQRSASA